uniref:Uncharacterized protein n=1 Tax=Rhizophora mucronata TaxID=61149 RepID=A0A2P2JQZ6_RHIMU
MKNKSKHSLLCEIKITDIWIQRSHKEEPYKSQYGSESPSQETGLQNLCPLP